jgi:hypothetical protein
VFSRQLSRRGHHHGRLGACALGAACGVKQVNIFGEDIPVRARIYTINGTSGHADQADAVSESDKADNRMRSVAIATRRSCWNDLRYWIAGTDAGRALARAHHGAIVAALVAPDSSVADTASRTYAACCAAKG